MACAAAEHPQADGLSAMRIVPPPPLLLIARQSESEHTRTRMKACPETPHASGWACLTGVRDLRCKVTDGKLLHSRRRLQRKEKKISDADSVAC